MITLIVYDYDTPLRLLPLYFRFCSAPAFSPPCFMLPLYFSAFHALRYADTLSLLARYAQHAARRRRAFILITLRHAARRRFNMLLKLSRR